MWIRSGVKAWKGRPDPEVWTGAQQDGRVLLTQDLDFSDTREFVPGSHHGCVIFRLGNPGLMALTARVLDVMGMPEAKTWGGFIVIATDLKVRVRRG